MINSDNYFDENTGKQLIKKYGIKDTYKILAQFAGYESVPPTINEFIDDPEYLGDMLGYNHNEGHDRIFPFWRKVLNDIYPNPFYSPYVEVVVTGAIGTGKSTLSMVGVMYDICKLLHIKDPHSKYSILPSDQIVLSLMNATLGLANDVLFGQIMAWMRSSPFFKKKMKLAGKSTILPNKINISFGSQPNHFIGKAVFSAILSEINFQKTTLTQSFDNYNGIRQRLRSRFQTTTQPGQLPTYPGRVFVDSSKSTSGSFIEDFLLKNRTPEELSQILVIDEPRWNILPAWKLQYSGEKFEVFVGDSTRDPFLIDRPELFEGIEEKYILRVPIEYKSEFDLNLHGALQEVGGISTQASHKFISSAEKVDQAFEHINPVTKQIITLDYYNQSDILINYIQMEKIKSDKRPRFIHFDLAYADGGDRCGIASTRLDGISTISRLDAATGKIIKVNEPVFHTDFILFLEAKSGSEIPIFKLENFLIDLKAKGYPIAMVSLDGHQSKYMLQNLGLKHFVSECVSVDRTLDAYVELKQAILQNRIKLPIHPILKEEILKLELAKTRQKVDHPEKGSSGPGGRGSKDGSDALAGSVYTAKTKMVELRANITSDDLIDALQSRQKTTNMYDSLKDQMGLFDR